MHKFPSTIGVRRASSYTMMKLLLSKKEMYYIASVDIIMFHSLASFDTKIKKGKHNNIEYYIIYYQTSL